MALTTYRPGLVKFECEICTNDYDCDYHRPFVLVPCGHTFCAACIERLENEECPYDRKPFTSKMPNWEIERSVTTHRLPEETSRIQHFLRRFVLSGLIRGYNQLGYEKQLMLTLVLTIGLPVLLIFPFYMIYTGIYNLGLCAGQAMLPRWLILYGIFTSLCITLGVFLYEFVVIWMKDKRQSVLLATFLITALAFCFLTQGWLYFNGLSILRNSEAGLDYTDIHSERYCSSMLVYLCKFLLYGPIYLIVFAVVSFLFHASKNNDQAQQTQRF